MKGAGYLVAAYVGAGLLYVGYAVRMAFRARALEGRDRGRAR